MRINAKGQVTIPAAIRKRAGLPPGTELQISFDGHAVTIRPIPQFAPGRGAEIVAHLRDAGAKMRLAEGMSTMTTDEIMAMTRGE